MIKPISSLYVLPKKRVLNDLKQVSNPPPPKKKRKKNAYLLLVKIGVKLKPIIVLIYLFFKTKN